MKKNIFLFSLLSTIAFTSYSQGLTNVQFSVGVNSSSARINSSGSIMLPNLEIVSSEFSYNSGESLNYGVLLSWQLAKDKPWYLKSGVSWINMSFGNSATYNQSETNYGGGNSHEINQVDLPVLIGYKKTESNFDLGIDFGLIKTLWMNSEITQSSGFQTPNSNPVFDQLVINSSSFTKITDKYSLYLAPMVQYNFGKSSGVSLQPFYRVQLGGKRDLLYSQSSGSFRQFGINLGYNIRL
jgi:hypothetical protein